MGDYLEAVSQHGVLFDPECIVRERNGERRWHVAGFSSFTYRYVLLGETPDAVKSHYQKMLEFYRNQVAGLREQFSPVSSDPSTPDKTGAYLFEEISRLNNELVNMQRRLSKKNRELEDAMAEVKQLQGLIPICASCKKIRNDQGYWQEVEGYIQDHSEAEFTHGFCDTCLAEHYPEYADNISSRGTENT